jgi:peptide/nickel transport system substrate-binding protein
VIVDRSPDSALGVAASRRGRWKRRAAAVLAVVSLVVAVCGTVSGGSASAASGGIDPNGVLRVGGTLTPQGPLHFDPAVSAVNADLTWEELIFGTLLRWNAKGGLDPWMAKAYKVIDPQTVALTLRPGMKFTDGTPYDADAVSTGLLHTMKDATAPSQASRHAGFKYLQDVVVDSPSQLTLKLNAPGASDFLESLAHREGAIVDPKQIGTGQIETNPIGAGPYTMTSYRPSQILSLRKNKDFFDKTHWRIGGFNFLEAPTGPASTTALLADALDAGGVPSEDVAKIKADPRFVTISGSTDYNYVVFQECPTKPPFDNPAVRKAVQLAFDRNAIAQLAFQGNATPAYGFWPVGNPNYNPAVQQYNKFDPKQAKKLLANAGVSDASFELHYVASTNYGPVAEVMQSELKDIGINMSVIADQAVVDTFIMPQKPGAMIIPGSRRNADKYNRIYAPGVLSVLCNAPNEKIWNTVVPTSGLSFNDPARAADFKKAELLAAQVATAFPLVYTTSTIALSKKKVGGTVFFNPATGSAMYDDAYIKK